MKEETKRTLIDMAIILAVIGVMLSFVYFIWWTSVPHIYDMQEVCNELGYELTDYKRSMLIDSKLECDYEHYFKLKEDYERTYNKWGDTISSKKMYVSQSISEGFN